MFWPLLNISCSLQAILQLFRGAEAAYLCAAAAYLGAAAAYPTYNENKAYLAQLELELGLSLAKVKERTYAVLGIS